MSNYNERLDEICPICKGTTWQMNSDYEEVPCWHDIHDEDLKQAITSLIKELVAEAKIEIREAIKSELTQALKELKEENKENSKEATESLAELAYIISEINRWVEEAKEIIKALEKV